jgi:hypothetical protein
MYMKIRTLLYEFSLGDVEDPQLYAAGPLIEWERSEAGKWCQEHCVPESITWGVGTDLLSWGHRVHVYGDFEEQDLTYFNLKYKKFDQ